MKYSIIIPHFELPDFLDRLLSTIPNREDTEVLVIDDCSREEVCKQLDVIKSKYPKVNFYTTHVNGGGGCARNIGISKSKGDYLIFADADDYFLPSFDKLLTDNRAFKGDILFFNAISLDTISCLPMKRAGQLNMWINGKKNELNKTKENLRFLFGEPWCKMVKRDLITKHNISFDEIRVHNDTYFSYMIGYYAKHVEISDTACYVITDRTGSVSKNVNWDKWAIRTEVFAKKNRFLQNNNIDIFDTMILTSFWTCIICHNILELKRNFKIAEQYQYSPKLIIWKLLKWKLKNLLNNFKVNR